MSDTLPGTVETQIEDVATIILTGFSGPTGSNIINGTGTSMIINKLLDSKEENVVPKLHLEKYLTFVNDPNIKKIVTSLTNDSAAVQDIVNMLDLILADGKIDLADAPILLALVKKIVALRTSDLKLTQNLTFDNFLSIIKLVFTILAKEGMLKIANVDEFILDISKLINLMQEGNKVAESIPCCAPLLSIFFSK
jgi:hypothetical protein